MQSTDILKPSADALNTAGDIFGVNGDFSGLASFYRGKRVLVTGHTGFKGSWLVRVLKNMGAEAAGFSLPAEDPSLFALSQGDRGIVHRIGDIRDFDNLFCLFKEFSPQIVLHLAAQPLVRESYKDPLYTFSVNVMGTANVLECARKTPSVVSLLNITTDKVYENREWEYGYRECDPLGGYDPYSTSKACSELVTMGYKRSFFTDLPCAVSTARAGNVIGGGDFAKDRLVPDCVRAALSKKPITLRNPHSVRPFQHVLEPLFAYLVIAAGQYNDKALSGSFNIGPEEKDCVETGDLAKAFAAAWDEPVDMQLGNGGGPHEAGLLKLDISHIKKVFGWQNRWDIKKAAALCAEWTKVYRDGGDICGEMDREIKQYMHR